MYSSTTQRSSVVRDIVATDKTNQLSKLIVSNSTINNSVGRTINDAADNASAVPGEDKPRPAGSRPTSTASSRLSSRDVLKSS
ncbi:hypothetical protein T06_16956 [Trichinella sp. T6]|nr:hypothetical protein T06_16956 [Trichinella sp. T6]